MADIIDINGTPQQSTKGTKAGELTEKQATFARLVGLEGLTLTAAYRQAYGSPHGRKTNWSLASNLANHPGVAAKVKAYVEQRERTALHDPGRIRAYVVERLMIESMQAEHPGSRVRALELLGKIDRVRLFRESDDESKPDTRVSGEIKDELKQRLTDYLKRAEGGA